jgi:hypothetical protein
MNLIKLVGVSEVRDFLKLDGVNPENTIIVTMVGMGDVANNIDSMVPKNYTYYRYQILIPTTAVMNIYYQEGLNEKFIDECFSYWARPDVLFFVNEMIRTALMYDYNLAIITSVEENDDFHLLDILCDRIETLYRIKPITFKKFKKGKSSKIKADSDDIFDLSDKLREELIHKLDLLGITLPRHFYMRITKKTLKKFPKELRAEFAQYLEE